MKSPVFNNIELSLPKEFLDTNEHLIQYQEEYFSPFGGRSFESAFAGSRPVLEFKVNRAVKWMLSSPCAIVTAWHPIEEGVRTRKQNDDDNRDLMSSLREKGYGVAKVKGCWDGGHEYSYFVFNPSTSNLPLRSDVFHESRKYQQVCFLYIESDRKAYFIYTDEEHGLGRTEEVGSLHINRMSDSDYTEIGSGRISFSKGNSSAESQYKSANNFSFRMKIIHTADLHLGQVIYQNYDRVDEHEHYFAQLEKLCRDENPDALLVSGDVFDIQQPSASIKKYFTDHFVRLHTICPKMKIVITAGNHDSASRIQADSAVWELANATLIGIPPSPELLSGEDGWQDNYIVKTDNGYIIALPYMTGERTDIVQSILDRVNGDNTDGKPVVMMGHLAVSGVDVTGHDMEIGKLRTQSIASLGEGYDYIALGHIHKPQTIGHQEDCFLDDVTYPSGAVRYSGSALHVSFDEKYPHTVSIVEMERRGGDVRIRQSRIDELRHFYDLPLDGGSFSSAEEALKALKDFADEFRKGYVRFRFDYNTSLPSNFASAVYDILRKYGDEVRFNPKHIWVGAPEKTESEAERPTFEVAELQQMTDPMTFIEKTRDQYPGLDMDEVRAAFEEVKEEMKRLAEEELSASKAKAEKKTAKKAVKASEDEVESE